DTAETTCFGKNFKTYIPSLGDGTVSLDGLYDGSTGAVDDVFSQNLQSSTDAVATVTLGPAILGGRSYTMQSIITSYQIQSPVSDVVSINLDLQADQGVFSGWQLVTPTASGTGGNGTGVNTGAAANLGWIAVLHVFQNTRNGTFDIKIQDSADNI